MFTSKVIYQGSLRNKLIHVKSGTEIITDAPVDNHGLGTSFSPTDLTATSLATCMMTVIGIACDGRNLNVVSIEADVTKIMAENPRRIAEVKVSLQIKIESITESQKEILVQIGRTCPVALSLHPDIIQDVEIKFI